MEVFVWKSLVQVTQVCTFCDVAGREEDTRGWNEVKWVRSTEVYKQIFLSGERRGSEWTERKLIAL